MENVVLTVHLLLAVALIVLVLLQRSEGGGLGMGGGGGGVMTGRQAANALSKLTWILAIAFLVTSMSLTIMAARNSSTGSVIDQLDLSRPAMPAPESSMPALPSYAPPPAAGQPITPPAPLAAPAASEPAATEPATTEPVVTPPAAAAPEAAAPAAPAQTPVETAPVEAPAATAPATEPAPEATPAPATAPASN